MTHCYFLNVTHTYYLYLHVCWSMHTPNTSLSQAETYWGVWLSDGNHVRTCLPGPGVVSAGSVFISPHHTHTTHTYANTSVFRSCQIVSRHYTMSITVYFSSAGGSREVKYQHIFIPFIYDKWSLCIEVLPCRISFTLFSYSIIFLPELCFFNKHFKKKQKKNFYSKLSCIIYKWCCQCIAFIDIHL